MGKPEFLNLAKRKIRGDTGTLLRPSNPHHPSGCKLAYIPGDLLLQISLRFHKQQDEVQRLPRFDIRRVRIGDKLPELLTDIRGDVDQCNA